MEELVQVKEQIKIFVKECNDEKSLKLLDLLATGKMLRSKLILKIAGVNEQSIKLCAIVEMIHAASLLHDDVIDEADTRRGKPSINALFDNKTSIMFGDILYSKAFTELSQMDSVITSYSIHYTKLYETSDYIPLISKKIGIPITLVPTKDWPESIDLAKQRKCDIFSLAMPTPDRLKYMKFTKPYVS